MSYQRDREQFYMTAGRIGLSQYTADRLLRYASTLQRLAVAQCNGDWPADNGERKVIACCKCESLWAPSVMLKDRGPNGPSYSTPTINRARSECILNQCPTCQKYGHTASDCPKRRICPDCRTAELVRACLDEHNRIAGREAETLCWEARIEGDPRSYVLRLVPRGTSDEDYQSGRVRPIYVPGRER